MRRCRFLRFLRTYPQVELLDDRCLLSAIGFAQPTHLLANSLGTTAPLSTAALTGYAPSQIRHAYGFDQITFGGKPGDGSGTTIAIVDAYDDPNIANDLHQFDLQFGLPDPVFTKVNQSGGTTMPAPNGGWISEIALDVEWAHAIAPGANILLVEASDNSFTNLLAAVRYAASQPGVVTVSMSWGGGESPIETFYDMSFLTPSGHNGVTFIASSGDSGAPPIYPAISPNVLSVGGTTLSLDSQGTYLSESGWAGTGGGISWFEMQPLYQHGVVTQSIAFRTNPDVAYDANPYTGFPVYDSYNNGSLRPWSQFGGTSDAAPQWAALIAIADQGRALAGKGSLDGPSLTLPMLYQLPAADFNDITFGVSMGRPAYADRPGYDLVTGRGTPIANKLVADLVGNAATTPTHFGINAPGGMTAGSPFSVTVSALDASNNVITGYTGTVHFSSSDGSAILPANYTFTAADKGMHTFSGVALTKAGAGTVSVNDTSAAAMTGSATLSITAASPSFLVFSQQPTNTPAFGTMIPAVTVQLLDAYANLVNSDDNDAVSIALGVNPGGGSLSGTLTETAQNGVATFDDLSISRMGNGYTLVASCGSLRTATSASFNITTASAVIEGFEHGLGQYSTSRFYTAARSAPNAAHDGGYGLDMPYSLSWIYRADAAAQVQQGETISVWVRLPALPVGRAYFGFGASATGTLSLVLAADTGQLILQDNSGYGFSNLAAVPQTYLVNHWYRLVVLWGVGGAITGQLYDSNGTSLLNSVQATDNNIRAGGIAFLATVYDKYFDTVTATQTDTPATARLDEVVPTPYQGAMLAQGFSAYGPLGIDSAGLTPPQVPLLRVSPTGTPANRVWSHEDDSRTWAAPALEQCLEWWLSGRITTVGGPSGSPFRQS